MAESTSSKILSLRIIWSWHRECIVSDGVGLKVVSIMSRGTTHRRVNGGFRRSVLTSERYHSWTACRSFQVRGRGRIAHRHWRAINVIEPKVRAYLNVSLHMITLADARASTVRMSVDLPRCFKSLIISHGPLYTLASTYRMSQSRNHKLILISTHLHLSLPPP